MIRNNTVHYYNTNRSRPVTIQCINTWVGAPYSDLGSDYSPYLLYGFSPVIYITSVNISYRYCLITLVT